MELNKYEKLELEETWAQEVLADRKLESFIVNDECASLLEVAGEQDKVSYAFEDNAIMCILADTGLPIYLSDQAKTVLRSFEFNRSGLMNVLSALDPLTLMDAHMGAVYSIKKDGDYLFEFFEKKIKADPKILFTYPAKAFKDDIKMFLGTVTVTESQAQDIAQSFDIMGRARPASVAQMRDAIKMTEETQNDMDKMEKLFVEEELQERQLISYIMAQEKKAKTSVTGDIDAIALIKKFNKTFLHTERQALLALNAKYHLLDMAMYSNEQFDSVIADPLVQDTEPVDVLATVVRDPLVSKLQAAHDNKQAVFSMDVVPLRRQPTAFVLMCSQATGLPAARRYLFKTSGRNMLLEGLTQEKVYTQVAAMKIRPDEVTHLSRNPWIKSVIESRVFDYPLGNLTKLRETEGNTHLTRFQFNTVESMKDPEMRAFAEKLIIPKAPMGSVLGESQPPVAHICAQLTTRPFATLMIEMHQKIWKKKLEVYEDHYYTTFAAQCERVLAMYDLKSWNIVPTKFNTAKCLKLYDLYKLHIKEFNTGVFNDSSKYFEAMHHCGLIPNPKTLLQIYLETNFAGWAALTKSAKGFITTASIVNLNKHGNDYARPLYHEGDDATYPVKSKAYRPLYVESQKKVFIDLEPKTVTMVAGGDTEAERYQGNIKGRLLHYVEDLDAGQMEAVSKSLTEARGLEYDAWVGLIDPKTLLALTAKGLLIRMIFPPIPPFRSLIPTVVDLKGEFMPKSLVTGSHVMTMLSYMTSVIVYAGHEYVTFFHTTRMEFDNQYKRWEHFNYHCALHIEVLEERLRASKWNFSDITALKRSESTKGAQLKYNLQGNQTEINKMNAASFTEVDDDPDLGQSKELIALCGSWNF